MKTLDCFLAGEWRSASGGFRTLHDPSTEEPLAQASSQGLDLPAALDWARKLGGPTLRKLTFAERGAILKNLAKFLREHRAELLALSAANNGTTESDGAFDIDGAGGTLAFYGGLGQTCGERHWLEDGEALALGKTGGFWARHALVPRPGVAVHINAFNFPAWGFAEKFACAFLAGVPVITKPATATALVAHRMVELALESGLLPEGSLQLVLGDVEPLLERLGPQDVLAFTGSAATAERLRGRPNLIRSSVHVNVEADSLNAAVLAPDVTAGSPTFERFVADVVHEMTQKAGQKCTAVRRILVPEALRGATIEAVSSRLARVVAGDPRAEGVTMGPLATADQLRDALDGIAELLATARLVLGSGQRVEGHGAPAGKGFFLGPTLLEAKAPQERTPVHWREVFGPVATLLAFSGDAEEAAALASLAEGTLVTSVYSDDPSWVRAFLDGAGAWTGRIYWGSAESSGVGSGAVLPGCVHGGPGRAGGGEELGGLRGLRPYLQRLAVQGQRSQLSALFEG